MEHTTIAVDLAKSVFQIAISHRPGRVAAEHRLSRARLLPFFATQPTATVLLEACGSAHHWGRALAKLGHTVRLLPPHETRRYVRRNKTDQTDARAMLEAARNEEIHTVPIKSEIQQAVASLHRIRTTWVRTRTARLNTLRGLLREFGITIPVGARHVVPRVGALIEDAEAPVPMSLRATLAELCEEITWIDAAVRAGRPPAHDAFRRPDRRHSAGARGRRHVSAGTDPGPRRAPRGARRATERRRGRPSRSGTMALAQTAQVARLFPDQAVVLVSPDLAGTHIPTSLAYLHDADAILVQERNPDDQVMRRVIRAWLARGRAVFIVVGLRDFSFFASDLALEAVGSAHLTLRTLERTRTRVPQAVVLTPIQLQLFRVTRTVGPDRTAIDVGTPADDLLYDLRGFHAPERDQDPARGTFRWTGPRASLTLPGGRDVTLVVAGGRPPGTPLHLAAAPPKNHSKHGVLSRFVPLCPA